MKSSNNIQRIIWGLLCIMCSITYDKLNLHFKVDMLNPAFMVVTYILAGIGTTFIFLGLLSLTSKYIMPHNE